MSVEGEVRGRVALVRTIDADTRRVTVEYRSGESGWFRLPDEIEIEEGTLWIIGENGTLDPAPDELWRDRTTLTVVEAISGEELVVDTSTGLRTVPVDDIDQYSVGNTIEMDPLGNVLRVVLDHPVRRHGLGEREGDLIAPFRREQLSDGPGFETFGGYEAVVSRAKELVETPIRWRKEFAAIGARPVKGVLFSGPPGTGKTKLASLIANESQALFYEVPGPAVVSKWVGDSEKALRLLFKEARDQDAAIIFFDEIDSIAGRRDGDSHEFSRRVVAQLLTEMDDFTPDTNVVVIGATNRITDIDPALRRPGRFDWVVDFPMPSRDDREAILRVSAATLATEGDLPHAAVADQTDGWAPADLTAIMTEAALLAVKDGGRRAVLAEDYLGGFGRLVERRRVTAALDGQEEG